MGKLKKIPPRPEVGDRVHAIGPHPRAGEVRTALVDEAYGWVVVVRYWYRHRRAFGWQCVTQLDWEYGLVRPGPIPKQANGRWPWETHA